MLEEGNVCVYTPSSEPVQPQPLSTVIRLWLFVLHHRVISKSPWSVQAIAAELDCHGTWCLGLNNHSLLSLSCMLAAIFGLPCPIV